MGRSELAGGVGPAPVVGGGDGAAVGVLAYDPGLVAAEGGADHLAEVPGLVALEVLPAPGRGRRVADVRVVGPDDDLGFLEVGPDAQQGGRHVLVPGVPAGLAAGGLAHTLLVVLVGRDHHLAVLLRAQPLHVRARVRVAAPLQPGLDPRQHLLDVARDPRHVAVDHGVAVLVAGREAVQVGEALLDLGREFRVVGLQEPDHGALRLEEGVAVDPKELRGALALEPQRVPGLAPVEELDHALVSPHPRRETGTTTTRAAAAAAAIFVRIFLLASTSATASSGFLRSLGGGLGGLGGRLRPDGLRERPRRALGANAVRVLVHVPHERPVCLEGDGRKAPFLYEPLGHLGPRPVKLFGSMGRLAQEHDIAVSRDTIHDLSRARHREGRERRGTAAFSRSSSSGGSSIAAF